MSELAVNSFKEKFCEKPNRHYSKLETIKLETIFQKSKIMNK